MAAEATVVVAKDLTSVVAMMTAVKTAMEMATLALTAVMVTAAMMTALKVSCSQRAGRRG